MSKICLACGWTGDPEKKKTRPVMRKPSGCPECSGTLQDLAARSALPQPSQLVQPFDLEITRILNQVRVHQAKPRGSQ